LAATGIAIPRGLDDELKGVAASVAFEAPFSTFVHNDPCPDNVRWSAAAGLRLFDFEFAGIGSAFIDAVYGRAPFPSCWCFGRIPRPVVEHMERVYRRELAKAFPDAWDDRVFARGLADGMAYWALVDLARLPRAMERELAWGVTTYRTRLRARFHAMAETADETGCLPRLGALMHTLSAKLARLWPETGEVPYYPAFRPT
jgi:hypothetical protein